MANPIDRYECGIVFYGTTSPTPPTYTDINGQTQTAITLTNAMRRMPPAVDSAYFHVGGVSRYTLQVDVDLGDDAEIDLGLLGHFDRDPAQPFGELASFRNDNQLTRGIHQFVTSGRFILETANLGAVVEGAIQALVVADGEGTVVVRMRVER